MAVSRYDNRRIVINKHENYKPLLDARDLKHVRQYSSPWMRFPTPEEMNTLNLVGHTWKAGDRFYKLAEQYYADPELWFIIAWFNQKPTEAHVAAGETLRVPLPLDRILQYLEL
jgi:hypothetical protein